MNAIELTKVVTDLERRLNEAEKKIEFLEQVTEKQALRIQDLEIDVRQK